MLYVVVTSENVANLFSGKWVRNINRLTIYFINHFKALRLGSKSKCSGELFKILDSEHTRTGSVYNKNKVTSI